MTEERSGYAGNPDAPVVQPAKRRREKPGIFWFLSIVLWPIMTPTVKYQFVDGHKIPATGAFVLAPNHFSNIDPVVVGYGLWKLGRNPRFLAKAGVFKIPVVGWLLRKSGQIPVDRTSASKGRESLSAANELVAHGRGVIVYPEGSLTRDPDLWPMRGKTGAVRLALEAGVPLIPAVHWGTQEIMPRYSGKLRLFRRKPVTIRIGDPVDLSAYRGRGLDASTLNEATTLLMNTIASLLGEVRGEQPPVERWDPADHGQAETGRI